MNRTTAGRKALSVLVDLPVAVAVLIALATVSFWTAVTVRYIDRRHLTLGETTEQ